MDRMLSIFQSVSGAKREDISIFLKAFSEHQCFQQAVGGKSEFVSHVTGLLSNAGTRYQGLLLLDEILRQCSLDILEQKGALWAGLCIKTCSQKNMFACVPMACRSLKTLIEKSVEIPELSKAFTNHLLGNFFDALKHSPSSGHLGMLECIETGLRVYPASCGPHRGAIEKFVGAFIDYTDENIVQAAGKCLQLLQQIRGGGTVGISYSEAWQKLQLHIVSNLHETLNHIYSDCPEIYDHPQSTETNIIELELNDDPIKRASQLFIRLKNLVNYLVVALTEPFPVAKPIMPRIILNLIQRGLGINCVILGRMPTANNLAIGALLPQIHTEFLSVLDALILTLKSNMALYASTVLSCILETLKWTSSGKSSGVTKPYLSLRQAAYKTMALWNETMKYGSCCELIAEYLVQQIKYDILPFQNEVTLKVLSGGKKHMSKKARRQLHKAQNEQSNISQTHSKAFNPHTSKVLYSDEGNQELCAAALDCLKYILMASSCFLKPIVIKDILDTIFSIAIHVINYDENTRTELYSNHVCRAKLFEVICTTVTDPHHLCPPPLQLVIDIFTVAQAKDKDAMVRSSCNRYMRVLEKVIHPQKESIFYPINKNEQKKAFQTQNGHRHQITEDEEEEENEKSDLENVEQEENIVDLENSETGAKSETEDYEISTQIDLTEPLQEEHHLGKPPDAENISDTEEAVDHISVTSTTQENSPEVMEVPFEENLTQSQNSNSQSRYGEVSAESEKQVDDDDQPEMKKRKTESDSEAGLVEEKGKEINATDNKDETMEPEADNDRTKDAVVGQVVEDKDKGEIKTHATDEDAINDCMADFVYELNQESASE